VGRAHALAEVSETSARGRRCCSRCGRPWVTTWPSRADLSYV